MAVSIGDMAPAFTLASGAGTKVSLADFAGKWVVLYFYPKDDTPGCTVEACGFRDSKAGLEDLGAEIIGVSPDGSESHANFAAKYDLNFTLLADPEHKVADAYGAWGEKKNYGKIYFGIKRSTYLISPEGKVAHIWPNVRPEEHSEQVIKKICEFKGE